MLVLRWFILHFARLAGYRAGSFFLVPALFARVLWFSLRVGVKDLWVKWDFRGVERVRAEI